MHIAIAGNIGSGKTTLAGLLAKHYGWAPYYEDVDYWFGGKGTCPCLENEKKPKS